MAQIAPATDGTNGWRASMTAALLATLARPGAWPVALLGFLVRGGIVALLVPIVVVPTTPGLANVIAPSLVPLVFGQPSPDLIALVAGIIAALVGWLVVGGLVGAWCDRYLVAEIAAEEQLPLTVRPDRAAVFLGFAARLIAHLPLALALAWGAFRIVDATYRELILPAELATPIVVRVLRDVPDATALIAATWLLGQSWGGLAQRRIAAHGDSLPAAVFGALSDLVRRAPSSIGTAVGTTLVLVAGLAPAIVACGIAWSRVASLLAGNPDPRELAVSLGVFLVLWLAALLLAGALATWRAFAWTIESTGRRPHGPMTGDVPVRSAGGTIGSVADGRPGEWSSGEGSGTI